MAQSTILATGTTAASSTDIVVAAGAVVTVGVFSATPSGLRVKFKIFQDTPGADNLIGLLGNENRATQLNGPGTYRVDRPLITDQPFGVFLEE